MPELPEVETVVRTLEHQLQQIEIMDCRVLWDNIIAMDTQAFIETIRHKKIQGYHRHGKYLMFDLGSYVLSFICE